MKQLKYYLMLLAGAVLLACGPGNKQTNEEVSLSLAPSALVFEDQDASHKFVTVTTSADWTASVPDSWVVLSKTSGQGTDRSP